MNHSAPSEQPRSDVETRLDGLVHEVLCWRARHHLDPIDPDSLRGAIARAELRLVHLRALGARPTEVLNGLGDPDESAALQERFVRSTASGLAAMDDTAQRRALPRVTEIYRVLAEHFSWPTGARALQLAADVGAGWKAVRPVLVGSGAIPSLDELIDDLSAVAPTVPPLPLPLFDDPVPPPPMPPPCDDLSQLPRLLGAPITFARPRFTKTAVAIEQLALALNGADTPGLAQVAHKHGDIGSIAQDRAPVAPALKVEHPVAPIEVPTPLRTDPDVIRRCLLYSRKRRERRWKVAMVVGGVGALVGVPAILEGLVAQSLWLVLGGALVLAVALVIDFFIARPASGRLLR